MWQNVVSSPSYYSTYSPGTGNQRIFLCKLRTKRCHRNAHCNCWNCMTYVDTLSHYFCTDYVKRAASECAKHNKLTCDRGAGRPRRDGVSPLIEEDVGATCTHLRLWNSLGTAVIITVPLTIHRVPAEGCNHNSLLAESSISCCQWPWSSWRSCSHLCNVRHASLRGGCTRRTDRTESLGVPAHVGRTDSSRAAGQADGRRRCGSPCGAPCPGRPGESALRWWACSFSPPLAESAWGGGWVYPGASTGSSSPCPAGAACSGGTSTHRLVQAEAGRGREKTIAYRVWIVHSFLFYWTPP